MTLFRRACVNVGSLELCSECSNFSVTLSRVKKGLTAQYVFMFVTLFLRLQQDLNHIKPIKTHTLASASTTRNNSITWARSIWGKWIKCKLYWKESLFRKLFILKFCIRQCTTRLYSFCCSFLLKQIKTLVSWIIYSGSHYILCQDGICSKLFWVFIFLHYSLDVNNSWVNKVK